MASESPLGHRSRSADLAAPGLRRLFGKRPVQYRLAIVAHAVVSQGEQNNATSVKMINLVRAQSGSAQNRLFPASRNNADNIWQQ